jgi:hypothetical protein
LLVGAPQELAPRRDPGQSASDGTRGRRAGAHRQGGSHNEGGGEGQGPRPPPIRNS